MPNCLAWCSSRSAVGGYATNRVALRKRYSSKYLEDLESRKSRLGAARCEVGFVALHCRSTSLPGQCEALRSKLVCRKRADLAEARLRPAALFVERAMALDRCVSRARWQTLAQRPSGTWTGLARMQANEQHNAEGPPNKGATMWPTRPVKHRPLIVGEESGARREKSDNPCLAPSPGIPKVDLVHFR